jgi:hypothetical protein
MDDDKIKLGVLWKNVSRKGNKPYLAGRVQQDTLDAAVDLMRAGGRFLILSNTKTPIACCSWSPNATRRTVMRHPRRGPHPRRPAACRGRRGEPQPRGHDRFSALCPSSHSISWPTACRSRAR